MKTIRFLMAVSLFMVIALVGSSFPALATRSTSSVLFGEAYLTVTEHGPQGQPVPATLRLDNVTYHDGQAELSGTVTYAGKTLPLQVEGTVFNSTINGSNARLVDASDKAGSFKVAHFEINPEPRAMLVAQDLVGRPSLALYLLSQDMRHFVLFELALDAHPELKKLSSVLDQKFPDADYLLHYWLFRHFKPTQTKPEVVEKAPGEGAGIHSSHEESRDIDLCHVVIWESAWGNIVYRRCATVRNYVSGSRTITWRQQQPFSYRINILRKFTQRVDTGETHEWSDVQLGTFSDPVVFQGLAPGTSSTGDVYSRGRMEENSVRKQNRSSLAIGIGWGVGPLSVSWSYALNWWRQDRIGATIFFDGPPGSNLTHQKKAEFQFHDMYLDRVGHQFHSELWVYSDTLPVRTRTMPARWIIPFYDLTHRSGRILTYYSDANYQYASGLR